MNPKATNAFFRFLLSGVFNTAVTYALYLALLLVFPYWLSYSIAFGSGILLAYALSRNFVFGTALSGRRMLAFPLVYLLQYLVGLAFTYLWVDRLHLPPQLAPLAALCVTIPMTFLLQRQLFHGRAGEGAPPTAGPTAAVASRLRWQTVLALFLPSLLIVALLWLPFGTALRGLIEEWDVLGLFTINGLFFLATAGGPLAAHSIRPLTILPQAIGFWLDPDSFDYWHLVMAATLVLKGGAAALLGWLLLRSARWAMAFGALVLLYPADTMQLAFRGLHINVAVALVLLATALVVLAHETASRKRGLLLGAVAGALLASAALMYELSLALLPFPALVLLARDGVGGAFARVRARPELAGLWLLGAALWLLHLKTGIGAQESYQASVTGSQLLTTLKTNFPLLFSTGIMRALVGGWVDAIRMFRVEFSGYLYVVAAAAACCASILGLDAWLSRKTPGPAAAGAPRSDRLAVRLALCGFVTLVLGYAPYLLSPSHVIISQRTYLFATPGAALVVVAVLLLVARRARVIAAAAVAALLLLGFSVQAFQFRHYVTISETQRELLREIVENFDGNLGAKTLLILDGSNRLNHTWMLRTNLPWALTYLYGKPVMAVQTCLMPSRAWQVLDSLHRAGECIEEPSGWRLRAAAPVTGPGFTPPPPPPDIQLANDNLVVLRIGEDGKIAPSPLREERLRQLAFSSDPAARRYRGVLLPPALPASLQAQFASPAEGYYRWDFGRWWSMEQPTHGSGWREADWMVGSWRQDAAAWIVKDDATLVFDLQQPGPAGVLGGQFNIFATGPSRELLQLRLNGQPLKHQWQADNRFSADIPPGVVRAGRNVLEIHSPTATDYYGLASRLSWFEVRTR